MFQEMPGVGFEPTRGFNAPSDFKSDASAVSPPGLTSEINVAENLWKSQPTGQSLILHLRARWVRGEIPAFTL